MKKYLPFISIVFLSQIARTQNPIITSWLQNTILTGKHYVAGNSTPIVDATLANVQSVKYSANWSYITTQGIPTYVTGPFLDGNPSLASAQNAIFKIPRNPIQNTGTLTATNGGNIGIFRNGVAFFDYRDGASWKSSTNSMAGGPLGGMGDGVWNRDAIPAEKIGFDCAKGHPAMGNYHHHQNPSAFNLDINVISTICNLYLADGLYIIDSTQHSPLLGFAYDGFPVYGAYGYLNINGTGGITRMKSSFSLRSISTRTTYYTGAATAFPGPAVNTTYPIGTFKEDYQFNTALSTTAGYLDIHNGRFCVTPEYPSGMYCYFTTVDQNWNSAYPYIIGPTFYGVKTAVKVTSITETVTTFLPPTISITGNSTICSGANVTFTANISNGGTSPVYQWRKNGLSVGTNSNTYSSSALNTGDIITCRITTAISAVATSNSIVIAVNNSSSSSSSAIACDNYVWNGTTYTTSGTYTLTFLNSNGCLHTETLVLTINTNTASTSSASACGTYIWSANGTTYTTSGTYTATSLNSNGCLHTETLLLSISPCSSTLNVKLFIEGYYNASSNEMNPVLLNQGLPNTNLETDSITVEINNANSPYNTITFSKGIINTNGIITCMFNNLPADNYYVVIKQRNTIETWSANPVPIATGLNSYDFTIAANKAYGSNQSEVESGVWALYSGDLNVDDNIDLLDLSIVETDVNNFQFGYFATDINGDGNVDLLDLPIIEDNINDFIFSNHP